MLPSSYTESDDHSATERDLAAEVQDQLHHHSSDGSEELEGTDVDAGPGDDLEHGNLEDELSEVNAEEVVKPKKKALSKGVLIMGAGAVVMLGLAGGALYLKNDMAKAQRPAAVIKVDPSLTAPAPVTPAPVVPAAEPAPTTPAPVTTAPVVDPLAPASMAPVTGAPAVAVPPAVDPLSNGGKISAAPNNPFDSQPSNASTSVTTPAPTLMPTPVPVVEVATPKVKPVEEVKVKPMDEVVVKTPAKVKPAPIITETEEPVVKPVKRKMVKPRVVKPSVVNKQDMTTSEKHPSQELNRTKSSETYNGYEKLF